MLKKEKINFISEELNKLYPKTPTPLKHQNKFTNKHKKLELAGQISPRFLLKHTYLMNHK